MNEIIEKKITDYSAQDAKEDAIDPGTIKVGDSIKL